MAYEKKSALTRDNVPPSSYWAKRSIAATTNSRKPWRLFVWVRMRVTTLAVDSAAWIADVHPSLVPARARQRNANEFCKHRHSLHWT